MRVKVIVRAADGINDVRAHLNQSLRQCSVQKVAILAAGDERRVHVKRRDIDVMDGDFVGVMLDINVAELVTHKKISAGNPHVLRRE